MKLSRIIIIVLAVTIVNGCTQIRIETDDALIKRTTLFHRSEIGDWSMSNKVITVNGAKSRTSYPINVDLDVERKLTSDVNVDKTIDTNVEVNKTTDTTVDVDKSKPENTNSFRRK